MTRIGVVGLRLAPGKLPAVKNDRIDCGDGVSSWAGNPAQLIASAIGQGVMPLPIYNPRPFTLDAVKFRALCEACKAHGVTVIEFGNEVYYIPGFTATEYATEYAAALSIASAHGINLIFCCTGDYYDGKQWSQVEAGKGWLVDAVAAMGGHVPKRVAVHPYGEPEENGVLGGGNPVGLLSVIRMQHWHVKAFGKLAPKVWITEYGTTGAGSSQAENAADLVLAASALPFVEAAFWFAVQDGAEGGYGLFDESWTAKPSAAAFTKALGLLT